MWTFTSATRRGLSLDVAATDGEETKVWTYSYPMYEGQTAAKFKASVRKEIRAHLNHLNSEATPEDVSGEYSDL